MFRPIENREEALEVIKEYAGKISIIEIAAKLNMHRDVAKGLATRNGIRVGLSEPTNLRRKEIEGIIMKHGSTKSVYWIAKKIKSSRRKVLIVMEDMGITPFEENVSENKELVENELFDWTERENWLI